MRHFLRFFLTLFIVSSVETSPLFSLSPSSIQTSTISTDSLTDIKARASLEDELQYLMKLRAKVASEIEKPNSGELNSQIFTSDFHGERYKVVLLLLNLLGLEAHRPYFHKERAERDVSFTEFFVRDWVLNEIPLALNHVSYQLTVDAQFKDQEFLKKILKPYVKKRFAQTDFFFLGDILDRGPYGIWVNDTLEELRDLGVMKQSITGNHDFWAGMNLMGMHLPFYKGYQFADRKMFSSEELEEVIALPELAHFSGASVEQRKTWWARQVNNYNIEQDALQKKFDIQKDEVKQMYEGMDASKLSAGERKLWDQLRGVFFEVKVSAGFAGVGRVSLRWWKEKKNLLDGIVMEKSETDEYYEKWQRLQTLVDEVVEHLEQRYQDKRIGDSIKGAINKAKELEAYEEALVFRAMEAIMYGTYVTPEWWALDWSWHNKWGPSLMKEETLRLIHERQNGAHLHQGLFNFIADDGLYDSVIERLKKHEYVTVKRLILMKDLKHLGENLKGLALSQDQFNSVYRVLKKAQDVRAEIERHEIDGGNYLKNSNFKKLTKDMISNFRLFAFTEAGDLMTHGAFPIEDGLVRKHLFKQILGEERGGIIWDELIKKGEMVLVDDNTAQPKEGNVRNLDFIRFEGDESERVLEILNGSIPGHVRIFYKNKWYVNDQIFVGLTQIENDVKSLDLSKSEDIVKLREAIHLVNAWYADETTTLKHTHMHKYDKIGWRKILNNLGVVGQWVMGHLPYWSKLMPNGYELMHRKRYGEDGPVAQKGADLVFVDLEINSAAYLGLGGAVVRDYQADTKLPLEYLLGFSEKGDTSTDANGTHVGDQVHAQPVVTVPKKKWFIEKGKLGEEGYPSDRASQSSQVFHTKLLGDIDARIKAIQDALSAAA